MVVIKYRLGIGFDIEHNEDILHYVESDKDDYEEQTLVAYNGLIIKLPFFAIYIGDFYDAE